MPAKIKHKIIDGVELKCCYKCKQWLLLICFHKQASKSDGLHPECKDCRKQYYQKNRKQELERAKKWQTENHEYKKEYNKKWCAKNPEKTKEYSKKYRIKNPDKSNTRAAKRRALKQNATPENTVKHLIDLYYEVAAYLSGEDKSFEVDHTQPLNKGGLHHENNLQILEVSLNRQKHDKWPLSPEEKIRYGGFRI